MLNLMIVMHKHQFGSCLSRMAIIYEHIMFKQTSNDEIIKSRGLMQYPPFVPITLYIPMQAYYSGKLICEEL